MEDIFSELLNLALANALALLFAFLTIRLSQFLLGFSLAQEIKKGNKAAALVLMGVFIMLGLIVGLMKL